MTASSAAATKAIRAAERAAAAANQAGNGVATAGRRLLRLVGNAF